MIEYPGDDLIMEQARKHGLPAPVLIRDLVRIVEVMNLERQGFFGKESVLAGSMALRCFGSPRFTVYDADFSAAEDASPRPEEIRRMLAYEDDDLVIAPAALTPHDAGGTAWKSEPIRYDPVFTQLVPDQSDRSFKADISFRGLVCEGIEQELLVPYDLGLWSEPPTAWVMDPHEVVAEKALGWCVNRLAKHYADLGFVGLASQATTKPLIALDEAKLRNTVADKLEIMRALQPERYAEFASIDDLVNDLDQPPNLSEAQWRDLIYVREHRRRFSPELMVRAVRELLVPMLRNSADATG
jgi:Nucleotidyl transferase AbiEii toxin, Type IV TA system